MWTRAVNRQRGNRAGNLHRRAPKSFENQLRSIPELKKRSGFNFDNFLKFRYLHISNEKFAENINPSARANSHPQCFNRPQPLHALY